MPTIPELLSLGLQYHNAGYLPQAEQIYRQILQADPYQADALQLLGEIAYRYSRHEIAIDYITQAISLNPYVAGYYCNLGAVYHSLRRYEEAAANFERAIQLQPQLPEAHNNLGNAQKEQGKLDDAIASYRRAIELRPDYAFAYNNLGAALAQLGRADEAIASCREALRLKPDYAEAYDNLGSALTAKQQPEEAIANFQQALRLRPDSAATYNNLGAALSAKGWLDEAIACCRRAIELQSDLAVAHCNLGAALHGQGKPAEAIASYRQALRVDPDYADVHINLAKVLQDQWDMDAAIGHLREAIRLRPYSIDAHGGLGDVLTNQGKLDEARASYLRALALKPNDRIRIVLATMLPLVYDSMDHLHVARERLIEDVRRMQQDGVCLDLTQQLAPTPFYLAYQGENNRDLRKALAGLCRAPAEERPARRSPAAGRKIQIGFISTYFSNHTIARLTQSVVAGLSRERFAITVLSAAARPDAITEFFRQAADRFIALPGNLAAARRVIAELDLDLLFYTDIGMHPFTYTLAHSRLAPVQCVTWGHPETTGLPTIDYFLSSEMFETPEAGQRYTETLVRLKSFPPFYGRPRPPTSLKLRDHYGFSDDCHLYACIQSVFKLHPEFDTVLAGILRRDPKGIVALSLGNYPHWADRLRARLAGAMPDVVDRIRFVGWLGGDDFLNLHAIADVALDPVHFGGGRTTYEFLAIGLPTVTLPSQYLPGRLTFGMYQKMQLMDCVAASVEDYIDIAIKVGCEPAYREAIRAKILASNAILYDDRQAIHELEEFFQRAIAASS
jgi:predicted O-linked N-acetylglucosamine transferase (SPINDLY family)